MTHLRNTSVKILSAVVRFAPAASRKWAEAAQGELQYIESDWAALWWSLGSTRMLFAKQSLPVNGLYDVPAAAQQLLLKINSRTFTGSLAVAGTFAGSAWNMFHAPNLVVESGWILWIISALYMEYQLITRRSRKVPCKTDLTTQASLFRNELERQRDFHQGSWFWSRWFLVITATCCIAPWKALSHASAHPQGIRELVIWLILVIIAIPLNLSLARKYARQMEELDTAISESLSN